MGRYGGIGGLILLALDVWAILHIFQSRESNGTKVGWTVLVLALPMVGAIVWYFFGPRSGET
jgi:hypothetical protein